MKKEDKEQVVAELTERLQTADTLLVADYRGLTMPQIDTLRSRLLESGRAVPRREEHAHAACGGGRRRGRAAGPARGPERDRVPRGRRRHGRGREGARRRGARDADPRDPRRRPPGPHDDGGRGREPRHAAARSRCCAARCSARSSRPLNAIAGLVNAPLQNLYGLIDARIEQLEARATRLSGSQLRRRPRKRHRPRKRRLSPRPQGGLGGDARRSRWHPHRRTRQRPPPTTTTETTED